MAVRTTAADKGQFPRATTLSSGQESSLLRFCVPSEMKGEREWQKTQEEAISLRGEKEVGMLLSFRPLSLSHHYSPLSMEPPFSET